MPSSLRALALGVLSYAGLSVAVISVAWLLRVRDGPVAPEVETGVVPIHEEAVVGLADEAEPEAELHKPIEGSGTAAAPGKEQPGPRALETVKRRERPLILVDAGHGGGDGGAVWNGIIEKHLALTLALKLKAHLEKQGMEVRLMRSKDVFVSLERRAAEANRLQPDAFVSLHLNSAGNESGVRGIETYYSISKSLSAARALQATFSLTSLTGLRDRRGQRLAELVQRQVCLTTGASNRGIKERSYTVVHGATCPAVLVECGFISNPKEAALLRTSAYQEKLARGVANGVAAFLVARHLELTPGIEVRPAPAESGTPVATPEPPSPGAVEKTREVPEISAPQGGSSQPATLSRPSMTARF
jgi:N-acetylmuramoyl-L-alanine amidase